MSNLIEPNNYFIKGFFSWFGFEKKPFSKNVQKYVSTDPHVSIKKDLNKIRRNYRKSYSELRKEALKIV